MSATYFTLLTTVGEATLATSTAQGSPLRLTHMAVGDGNGNLTTPDTGQTRLVNERHRAPLNTLSVDPNNPNQIIAEQVLPEDVGGWWIREIGLYDEHDRLIAVGNCPPTYKPQLTEGSGRTQIIRMVLIVSHTENVALKIDPAIVLATRQYVDDNLSRHEQSRNHPDATLTAKGLTQLSNATNSTSETLAATAKAVKTAYDAATRSASTSQAGRVQLNDSTNSTYTTQAATANAVKRTYDEATRAASTNQVGRVQLNDTIISTSTTQAATANAVKRTYDEATRAASTNQAGRVQLNDTISSTSTTQAATANAVKRTYDIANRLASTSQAGRVQLNDTISSTSTTQAATAYAVKRTYDEATRAASTNQAGRVRLNDSISSTSTTQAATPNAVKLAYDRASEALPVGTPCPWPSLNIPSGWVKCAGQSFSTSSYPDLARAYPNGRLPDLRGEFIRGYDDGRGVDSGRSLLTAQGDAIRNITGTVTGISETFSYSGSGSGVFRRTSSGTGADGTPRSVDWSNAGTLDFDVSRVVPTANENRPRNIAFIYIVRAA